MKKDDATRRTAGWRAVLPWAIGGAVLGSYVVLVCSSYYIHIASDPHNWLMFAKNFAEEFGKSRWPYGYPLYLKGVLETVGPYWVFLANLPAMLGMFLAAGWMGALFAAEDRRADGAGADKGLPRSWGFLAVWVVVLGADSACQMTYLNPFRDPPSYLLLLASVGMFVRSMETCRAWKAGVSGALLGLACSVREPSVLMLLPLFAYGLWTWRQGRADFGPWRTAGAFALGLALGAAPMLVQSYLATHQIFVPHNLLLNVPQSESESKIVPGMYFDGSRLGRVGGMALRYYLGTEALVLLLAAAGLVAAVRRRNRLVLAVVAPSAFGYALFYAFYRIFSRRYFYVAVLFFALLAGYGLLSLLRSLRARCRTPRAGLAAGWLLLGAIACATSARLLGARAAGQPHQVPQAREMASAIRGMCPGADAIYADRPLAEWIDWFLGCETGPLSGFVPGTAGHASANRSEALRAALLPRLERGGKLYAAFWSKGVAGESDVPYVRRAIDRIPVASFDPTRYGAGGYANGTVWLYRLSPWTNLATTLEWPIPKRGPHGGAYWYMLDAGDWPKEHAPATVAAGGATVLPPAITHGGTTVGGADGPEEGGMVAGSVTSSDPLPREIPVRTGRLDEPIELDFRPYNEFDHLWRWSGRIRPPSHPRLHPGVGILSRADLELPVPWPALAGTVAELEIIADHKAPGVSIPVSVSEDGRLLDRAEVSGERTQTRLVIPLPHDPGREVRRLHFDVEAQVVPGAGQDRHKIGVECVRAAVHRWPAAYPVTIGIGRPGDAIHALSGFSRAEGRGEAAYRWTTGSAEVAVYLPATDRPLVLSIACFVGGMPAEAKPVPAPSVRVTWDGEELPGSLEAVGGSGDDFVWQGALPPGAGDGRTAHRIGIATPTWRPCDYGARDTRTLGIRIGRMEINFGG